MPLVAGSNFGCTRIVTVENSSRHEPWHCSRCWVGALSGLVASTCSMRDSTASFWPACMTHTANSTTKQWMTCYMKVKAHTEGSIAQG